MRSIWEEQQKHVTSTQDPPGISLYTVTSHTIKGGVRLPILRSAQGSTLLESFHLHVERFIPGTSASTVNFQAYLRLTRWNAARAREAIDCPRQNLRTFDLQLQDRVNALNQAVHGLNVFPLYQPPAMYTGELIGVEYLYQQSGYQLISDGMDLDSKINEGFEDYEEALAPLAQLPICNLAEV